MSAPEQLSATQAARLIRVLARTVGTERHLFPLGASEDVAALFDMANEAYVAREYKHARDFFLEVDRTFVKIGPGHSTARRNAALCLSMDGDPQSAYDEMLPWFRTGLLRMLPLWNFAMIAVHVQEFDVALEAFSVWSAQPKEELVWRCHLLRSALLVQLGRPEEAKAALATACAYTVDEQSVIALLDRVERRTSERTNVAISQRFGTRPWTFGTLTQEKREWMAAKLAQILDPRRPERFPHLNTLPRSDARVAERAIDMARDDQFTGAIQALDALSASRLAGSVRAWVVASIQARLGQLKAADELIAKVAKLGTMPGSVWWNWAAVAARLHDFRNCAYRLKQCGNTDLMAKPEVWLAMLLASLLGGDPSLADEAVRKASTLSERARESLVTLVLDLPDEIRGHVLEIAGLAATASGEQSFQVSWDRVASALSSANYAEALDCLESAASSSVRDLPEYDAYPLRPVVTTLVPRPVVRLDLQNEFRRGVAALHGNDPADALAIFEDLILRLPNSTIVEVNLLAALFGAGHYERATEVAQDLLAASVRAWRASNVTAALACLVAQQQFEEAKALLEAEKRVIDRERYHLFRAVIAEDNNERRTLAEQLVELVAAVGQPSPELLTQAAFRSLARVSYLLPAV